MQNLLWWALMLTDGLRDGSWDAHGSDLVFNPLQMQETSLRAFPTLPPSFLTGIAKTVVLSWWKTMPQGSVWKTEQNNKFCTQLSLTSFTRSPIFSGKFLAVTDSISVWMEHKARNVNHKKKKKKDTRIYLMWKWPRGGQCQGTFLNTKLGASKHLLVLRWHFSLRIWEQVSMVLWFDDKHDKHCASR